MNKVPLDVRLAPSTNVLRQLYTLSGNLCARPRCNSILVNANGTFVGEVCHIKAERPKGARYDKKLNADQRRAASNLILLCSTCHTLVDAEPNKYTVTVLEKWKSDRESNFREVGNTLRQGYINNITDEAELIDLTVPHTLSAFVKFIESRRIVHQIDNTTTKDVKSYISKLKHLAIPDRSLIVAIIEKAISLGGRGEDEYGIDVHPDDLKSIMIGDSRLSDYKIGKLGKTLERNGLGHIDVDEEPRLSVRIPSSGLNWSDLKAFLEQRGKNLKDLVCDLKFGLLD